MCHQIGTVAENRVAHILMSNKIDFYHPFGSQNKSACFCNELLINILLQKITGMWFSRIRSTASLTGPK